MKKRKNMCDIYSREGEMGRGRVTKGIVQIGFGFCQECQLGGVINSIIRVRDNQKEGSEHRCGCVDH